MIHLKKLSHSFHIHWLTYVYILLSIIGGFFEKYFYSLLIVCIHELCHLLMAYYFQFHIEKIELLPFGAYLSLKDFYFHSISEELCVVLAGPASHLFIYIVIQYLSIEYRDYLLMMNAFVFFFNLLPIYPMDGHRVICLILQSFIDLKNAFVLSLKISVFSLVLLGVFYLQTQTLIMIIYLFVQQFALAKNIPQYLRMYFSQIGSFQYQKKGKVHTSLIYRRGYHNYYWLGYTLYDEKEMVFELLKNVKK